MYSKSLKDKKNNLGKVMKRKLLFDKNKMELLGRKSCHFIVKQNFYYFMTATKVSSPVYICYLCVI